MTHDPGWEKPLRRDYRFVQLVHFASRCEVRITPRVRPMTLCEPDLTTIVDEMDQQQRKRTMSDGSDDDDEDTSPGNGQDNDESSKTMTEEVRKLEEKRAYNRRNAARARKRTKDQLAELCRKVEVLSDKNKSLEDKNEELLRAVASLTDENTILRRLIIDRNVTSSTSSNSGNAPTQFTVGNSSVQPSHQTFDMFAAWK
jgi:bZIP transcription factor